MNLLEQYADDIVALCRQYKVKRLSAFGSLVKGNFNESSDIDLIVDFEPLSYQDYAQNYFARKFSLEDRLGQTIDLLEEMEIYNPYFKRDIASHQKIIYAA